jgi:iron complex outermembrane receptor protein
MRNIFLFIAFSFVAISTYSQGKVEGYVKDKTDGNPIFGAHISAGKVVKATNGKGYFIIDNLIEGSYKIKVSAVGYSTQEIQVFITNGKTESVEISLEDDYHFLDEVVVSATRTESRISDIPGRVEVLSPEKLALSSAQSIDEALTLLSGVQNSRSFGLFSHKATISMRGVSGKEQARTLVLLNGIPVNKADGGSVNWNLISTGEIDRIEVVKGPGSALYGGNAMGGIINVVTKKPNKPIEARLTADYGTYNTRGVKGKFAGNLQNGFYWTANGQLRKSDGYITQSYADQVANPFIVKSTFDEKVINIGGGYNKNEMFSADIDLTYYDDMRGTGELVFQPLGNTTDHDTYQFRSAFSGKVGTFKWNASLFYLQEHYKRVSEWFKDDYTWYDVLSVRSDYGLLSGVSYSFKNHTLTTGFDFRVGAVDAADIYYTSTDKVDNRGKMNFYGIYVQDELSLFAGKVKLVAGLRYDLASFYDGAFIINSPSAETVFMDQYQFENLEDVSWGAVSPRLSVQYKPSEMFRLFAGYGRGFRPSVLDDLCRSGRVRGGFKVASPNLKPEYLDNLEIGTDYKPLAWLKVSASAFYSKGTDFLYYVSTGDSIDMGFGPRPIMIRSNISEVDIFGFETDFSATPIRNINIYGNYAFASSKISNYKPISIEDTNNLTGKFLTDVPMHSFALGAMMRSRFINAGVTCRYTGEMFVNDQNIYDEIVLSDRYPAAFTIDLKVMAEVFHYGTLSLSVQNILDKKIYESKGAVSPGRFIVLEVGVKY